MVLFISTLGVPEMENDIKIFAPTGEGKRSDCTVTVMVIVDMPGIGTPDAPPKKDES